MRVEKAMLKNQSRSRDSRKLPRNLPRYLGPLVTLLGVLLVLILQQRGIHLRHLDSILLVLVGFSAVIGGTLPGLVSTAIAVAMNAWHTFYDTSRIFQPADEMTARFLILCVAAPVSALVIGSLKRRSDRMIEERAAREEVERVQRRTAFLAEAGTMLDEPLDLRATVQKLTDLAVPFVAGWCTVELLQDDRKIERIAVSHSMRDCSTPPWASTEFHPIDSTSDHPVAQVIRSGEPIFRQALIVLPLLARGRTLGAMALACNSADRVFSRADLGFAQDLARRAALSVDNARLYTLTRRSHSLLKSALEATADGILVTDLNRRVVSYNGNFLSLWKIPESMMGSLESDLGLIEYVLTQLKDPEEFRRKVDELEPSNEGSLDLIEFKDGRVFERCSRPQLMDGAVVGRVWSFRDITSQRKDEILLREARSAAEEGRRNAALIAEMSGALAGSLDYETTLKRLAQLVVPGLADLCVVDVFEDSRRLARVAVVHRDPRKSALVERVRKKDPAILQAAVRASVQEDMGKLIPHLDVEALRGTAFEGECAELLTALNVRSAIFVPLLARGRTIGMLTLVTDESSERSYDTDDLELARDVARRAALAVDNSLLYSQARKAISARDEFLSIASHELKTPLTSLQLQLQLLMRLLNGQGNKPVNLALDLLDDAEKQCVRMNKLIHELLDISRIEAGHFELEEEDVDLAALIRDVVNRHRDALELAQCPVRLSVQGNALGRWDPMRIEQIVTNLVSNAMKYGKGKPIDIDVENEGQTVVLSVRDRGLGMSAEDKAHLFQRFERAKKTRRLTGTGLGLYIVKQIVDAHRGKIEVETEEGKGSRFVIRLPRNRALGDQIRRDISASA